MPVKNLNKINKYMDQSISELWLELSVSKIKGEHHFEAQKPSVKKGKNIFRSLETKLKQCICKKWKCCEKLRELESTSTEHIVAGVADCILHNIVGVPAVLIAVIIVKKGLSKFCECD